MSYYIYHPLYTKELVNRNKIIQKHYKTVIGIMPGQKHLVSAYLIYLGDHLCKIYPELYQKCSKGTHIHNLRTNKRFSLSDNRPFYIVAQLILEDITILVKINGIWFIAASLTVYPVDWDPSKWAGKSFEEFHKRVPGWKAKYYNGAVSNFDRLLSGDIEFSYRKAVFVQHDDTLLRTESEKLKFPGPLFINHEKGFRFKDIHIRREHQTFTALGSDAIVFTVYTRIDPMTSLSLNELENLYKYFTKLSNDMKKYHGFDSWEPVLAKYIQYRKNKK